MSKKLFTLFLLVLFAATLLNAQDKVRRILDDSLVPEYTLSKSSPNTIQAVGELVAKTNYDYFSNSVIRDQIVWDAALGTPHLLNMVRDYLPGISPTSRRVVHSYKDGGTWVNNDVRGAAAGWPQIDLGLTGDAAGVVHGVYHAGCNWFSWDGSTGYPASQFEATTDPSVQNLDAIVWLACSGNRAEFQFYKTEDFGGSYTMWAKMSDFSPAQIYWVENGGVEVGMSKSPNEQYLVYFGTNDNLAGDGGAHVWDGVPVEQADNAWVIYTEDAGANWTATTIGQDGVFDLVQGYHTDNYGPLFENFGQLDAAVANDGVIHVVANGYGLVFNSTRDTAIENSFPVLYWNSTSKTWVSISDPAIDANQEQADTYPGNGIGQNYPSISASEDGKVLYALWAGPEFSAPGTINVASTGLHYLDLYHAFSQDGGATWTYGGVFPGMLANTSETFGHAAQHLEKVDDNTYRAHIVYLNDPDAGVFVFGEGADALAELMYTTYDIVTTSVDDKGTLVSNFELAQNYPNPFNPSTKISYTLAERSSVTLKVYDVLGKEVANLVNTTQEAGSHTVNFDASNLASGLYIYTLNAGNFTSSKKMMLLK